MQNLNVGFKCTWNDAGFKGICSQETYDNNVLHGRLWCRKAKCRSFMGVPSRGNEPCYESIIFSEWLYGAGWDHSNIERPRRINNTGVGKIAFITTLEPGRQEKDRRIAGYFIIKNITGGEKEETVLLGDASDGFVVPSNINLLFWDYYKNPKAPGKKMWGTGLFRYLDDQTASAILVNLKTFCLSQGTGDVELSKIERALVNLSNVKTDIIKHLPSRDTSICPSCKKTIRENVNYCTQCRAKLISCQKCKYYNLEGDHYCSNCGDPLNREVGEVALNKSTVSSRAIKDRLLEYGKANKKTLEEMSFCRDPEADAFVKTNALAFLFGVIFDQGVRAEVAWSAPYELRKRLGHFDVCKMAELTDAEIESIICGKKKLHRFWKTTGKRIVDAARKVVQEYGCDAAKMWSDEPRAEDLEGRFREFAGIGQKKASMAVNILARDFGVPIQNWSGIDVSNDVMIKRVFLRAGLATRNTEEAIIEAGRILNPDYPGALDHPAWIIGREYCLNSAPICSSCPLHDICPKLM
jgi:uncharacterized HhH-GPD family protein